MLTKSNASLAMLELDKQVNELDFVALGFASLPEFRPVFVHCWIVI